ncbi:hypothetical protein AB9P05_23975 [Roseivirga sp. BDSF3-8]|uniref:hypothetical protein n=1 Tax=Roseivirga sp. BDSF3-8 TaxID=3241598 RepID=UPI0035325F11
MRCRKILIGFDSNESPGVEIDFVSRYLARGRGLVVGSLIRKFNTLPAICKCVGCGSKKDCGTKRAARQLDELAGQLQTAGQLAGFRSLVRREQDGTLNDLIRESRFADLLVVSQHTWRKIIAGLGKSAICPEDAVECPVLIVPDPQKGIDQVILTYNGTPEAMRGIKQFVYMLPELAANLPVTILTTYDSAHTPSGTDEKLFIEYMKEHFNEVALHKMDSHSEHTLISAVGLNQNSLVIINSDSPESFTLLNSLLKPDGDTLIPVELYTGRAPLPTGVTPHHLN